MSQLLRCQGNTCEPAQQMMHTCCSWKNEAQWMHIHNNLSNLALRSVKDVKFRNFLQTCYSFTTDKEHKLLISGIERKVTSRFNQLCASQSL